ncbi:MAG TPA: transglycosylase SLT domain-containing protein, partial [Ottowia sp.]|nr:transglycosylase SLT domain-containing protein [Ottowia sp.]
MPRVPMPEGPQFQPGGNAPQGRLAAPEASDIGQRQVMALGGAMQEFGASVGGIARDMQAQADELRVTDALNQYKERALTLQHDKDAGYLRVRGKDTFDRPDGKSLTEFYGGQLANAAGDIAGTLGNDRQRAAFMKHASDILTTFRGGVQEHEAREYQTYQLSVSDGVVSTALRDVSLNWNNPDAVDAAIERIRSEVYRQARLTGNSAEWQEAQARKMTSNAHKVGLLAALDANDAGYASQYLKKYSGQLEADDILSVKGQITKAYNAQLGMAVAADHAARATVQMEPTDLDRVFGITEQTESGGDPNAVSPVGARGLMQVMPETAKAPGFGIKPSNGSKADDVRVGKELLAALIKNYSGDLGKAWAAYNAGRGWVDAAVSLADKAQPGTKEADWFWQLTYGDVKLNGKSRSEANRKQTRDYVNKNLA